MLAALAAAAVFVTKFTEYTKDKFGLRGWPVSAVALGLGVVIAFGFGIEAFGVMLGDFGVAPEPWVDKIFTGLTIGAGAGFASDIAGR